MIVRLHLIFMTFIRCYGLIHFRRLPISRVDVDANHTVTFLNYISGFTEKPRKRGAFVVGEGQRKIKRKRKFIRDSGTATQMISLVFGPFPFLCLPFSNQIYGLDRCQFYYS